MKKESILLLVSMLGLNVVVVSGQEQNISNTEQATVIEVEETTVTTEEDNAYTKIVAIGDSNFQGLKDTNTGPQDNYNQPLPYIIGEGLGVENVENNSIAGSTISSNKNYENYEPMVERISQLSKDADLVLLQGGINDWKNGIPLGEFGSTNTDDFYGALDKYYGTAKEIYSGADILALTITDTTWGRAVDDGVTLEQWADAQIQVAGKYGIPIYDLLRESGFDPKTMSVDGLHYNQDVAKEIGTGILTKIESDERFRVYEETTTVETTETPVETTEEPVETTEEPVETTEEPVESTEEPVETTEEPVESTEEPVETTEEPVEITEEPVEITEEPVESTEEPVETTEEPVESTEEPVETTEETVVESTEEPVEITEEPVEITEEPVETTEEIVVESTEEPVETTEETVVESTEEPVETTEETVVESTETPVETTETPVETTEETKVENTEETEVENNETPAETTKETTEETEVENTETSIETTEETEDINKQTDESKQLKQKTTRILSTGEETPILPIISLLLSIAMLVYKRK